MKYFVFIFLVFSSFSNAQYQISGQLKDISDKVVVGSVVKLKNHEDIIIKSTISDENGNFTFENIPKGKYNIEIISVFL